MDIKVGVTDFVHFLFNSGDLTGDFYGNRDLEEGKKAHQYLQNLYTKNDEKEVYIKKEIDIEDYHITISGYLDGLLNNGSLIEEIKSTSKSLDLITENYHLSYNMQLKVYAYLYTDLHNLEKIDTRLRFIKIDSYETKDFEKTFFFDELSLFFNQAITEFLSFKRIIIQYEKEKLESIKAVSFPFSDYRQGQHDLMAYTYQNMRDNGILYAIAPTGIGKTIATLFSTIKLIDSNAKKVFYLTAKSLGKSIAVNAFSLLYKKNLVLKSIELTSKDKMCFQKERNCDPSICKYAKGFFERINGAVKNLFIEEMIWTQELIRQYAEEYTLCPFEFQLEMSLYADVLIGDYNYVFDPIAHLKRYFDDIRNDIYLLVDEAHNLVSRSKDMYSATININDLILLRRLLSSIKPSSRSILTKLIKYLSTISDSCEKNFVASKELNEDILNLVYSVSQKLETVFSENITFKRRNEVFNLYFDLLKFKKISEYYSNDFRFVLEKAEGNTSFSMKCLNASKFVSNTLNKLKGTVFFSATLFPLDYYMTLLTNKKGETLIIPSPFDPRNLNLIIKNDVSTKYSDREKSVLTIVKTIDALVSYKKGNYIVFFPSYQYLHMVEKELKGYELIVQNRDMSEAERNEYVDLFRKNDETQIGLFVMGGSFAEGIDYIGDMLSGVLVVSACLPAYGDFNNLLMEHFDNTIGNGFDFAYTYPGFTKVVQAVGRVIRSDSDRGVAILFDHRWNTQKYKRLMLREWNSRKTINDIEEIKNNIEFFGKKYK